MVEVVEAVVVETVVAVVEVDEPEVVVVVTAVVVGAAVVVVEIDEVVVAPSAPQAATSIATTVMNTMWWVGTRGVNFVMPGKR